MITKKWILALMFIIAVNCLFAQSNGSSDNIVENCSDQNKTLAFVTFSMGTSNFIHKKFERFLVDSMDFKRNNFQAIHLELGINMNNLFQITTNYSWLRNRYLSDSNKLSFNNYHISLGFEKRIIVFKKLLIVPQIYFGMNNASFKLINSKSSNLIDAVKNGEYNSYTSKSQNLFIIGGKFELGFKLNKSFDLLTKLNYTYYTKKNRFVIQNRTVSSQCVSVDFGIRYSW